MLRFRGCAGRPLGFKVLGGQDAHRSPLGTRDRFSWLWFSLFGFVLVVFAPRMLGFRVLGVRAGSMLGCVPVVL